MKPRVSIIISNRNDVSMLIVTIRSCIEEMRPLEKGSAEIIIVDNSDPRYYQMLSREISPGYVKDGTVKIFRQDFPCLFTAREKAIKEASGKYILCLDSHMLIGYNMIVDLVNYMDDHSGDKTLGFVHAPINWAHQHPRNSRHDRDLSTCELGNWNRYYDFPTTITYKGMPWICKKSFWKSINGYGALAEHKLAWGGGDMHIGLKPWLLGFKNWAIPTSPGIHIGPFPSVDFTSNKNIVKYDPNNREIYRLWSKSGVGPAAIGFLVSCYILGGESMMERNEKAISERFGKAVLDHWNEAISYGKNEKEWLDSRRIMSFEQLLNEKPWRIKDAA